MILRIMVVLVIISTTLAGTGLVLAAGAESGQAPADCAGTGSVLLQMDFSDLVDDCEYVSFLAPDAAQGLSETKLLENQKKRILVESAEELTENELRRLGVWLIPDGQRIMLIDLHRRLMDYRARFGDLPATAVDLFPELGKLSEAELIAMDRLELFQQCAVGINPVTGRLYDSFTNEEWTPGGYCVEVVDDPVEIAERWPHHRMPINPADPTAGGVTPDVVWQIQLFGAEPGTVIFDTVAMSN